MLFRFKSTIAQQKQQNPPGHHIVWNAFCQSLPTASKTILFDGKHLAPLMPHTAKYALGLTEPTRQAAERSRAAPAGPRATLGGHAASHGAAPGALTRGAPDTSGGAGTGGG